MASTSGDRVDLLAAGLGPGPMREQPAPELSEDSKLVDAARDGDRAAFGHLYERYARMVHGVLLARVPLGEVDDLVQDVFMKVLRQLSTLRETERFGAWLAAIARNLANDYYRRSVPEDQLTDDTPDREAEYRAKNGISGGDRESQAAAVLDAVRRLPDAYRETLILRLVEGMTGPEIATRTGMTHGSVRVNLHRGMEQLRAKLSSNLSSGQQETP
jgi:RNA polymerase sigma-70 factor, ECF subfamily